MIVFIVPCKAFVPFNCGNGIPLICCYLHCQYASLRQKAYCDILPVFYFGDIQGSVQVMKVTLILF